MGGQPGPGMGPGGIVPSGSTSLMSPEHPVNAVPQLMKRNPKTSAAVSAFAGVLVLVSAATGVAILSLPLYALALPALVSLALFITGGVLFSRASRFASAGGLDAATERRLIDVALRYRGRVTAMAVAREIDVSISEADAALTAMARAGHVTVDNDAQTGALVYSFPEIEAGLVQPGGSDVGPRRLP